MMPRTTKDIVAELMGVVDEWRAGSPKRDFTPILRSLTAKELRGVADVFGVNAGTKAQMLHDVGNRVGGLAAGEESFAPTRSIRSAIANTDPVSTLLPRRRIPVAPDVEVPAPTASEAGNVAESTVSSTSRIGEGVRRTRYQRVRDWLRETGPSTGKPGVTVEDPSPKDAWRRVKGAFKRPARNPVVEGAIPSTKGASAVAEEGSALGRIWGKIPSPVKKWGGRIGGALAIADLAYRVLDATQGRETRLREARTLQSLDEIQGAQEGAQLGLENLVGVGLARSVGLRDVFQTGEELKGPARDRAQVESMMAEQRGQILSAAVQSQPSDEEWQMAMRIMAGGGR